MDLNKYHNKRVNIELISGFFYEGDVTFACEDYLELIDRNGNLVQIKGELINLIREISNKKSGDGNGTSE